MTYFSQMLPKNTVRIKFFLKCNLSVVVYNIGRFVKQG